MARVGRGYSQPTPEKLTLREGSKFSFVPGNRLVASDGIYLILYLSWILGDDSTTIYTRSLLFLFLLLLFFFFKCVKGKEKSLSALNRGRNYFRIIDE